MGHHIFQIEVQHRWTLALACGEWNAKRQLGRLKQTTAPITNANLGHTADLAKQWGKTYGGISEVQKKDFSVYCSWWCLTFLFCCIFFRDRAGDYFFSLFWQYLDKGRYLRSLEP